jgi:uncharacterized protein with von Willebrand factor type A (vWA) domain
VDDELVHVYDATKRREYYLKTRHLKGRHHGTTRVVPPKKSRAQRLAEHRRHQEAQIAELKSKLERLKEVLAAEVKKAKARSGVKPTTTSSKTPVSSHKSSNSPAQKLTPAQKAKKAREEKKLREKNKPQSLDEQVQSLTKKIKTIQERIAKMRKDGSIGAKRHSVK